MVTIRINNRVFKCKEAFVKEHTYGKYVEFLTDCRIIYDAPNDTGFNKVYTAEQANAYFNKLYCAKYIDKVLDEVLKEFGYTEKSVRFKCYSELSDVNKKLERRFREEHIDLSYTQHQTNRGYIVSGNAIGISSTLIQELCTKSWKRIDFKAGELEKYLRDNKNIKVYSDDGKKRHEISRKELLKNTFGTDVLNYGYGSQASTYINTVELRKDVDGNLLLCRSSVKYD